MSFRGRGGRGGASMGGFRPMGIDIEPNVSPTELYPKMIVPIQTASTETERETVAQFFQLCAEIRDGPLFTGSNSQRGKVVLDTDQSLDDGIKRYTDRYIKKRKIGRSVEEHPYVLSLFPSELYGTMGLKKGRSKKLDISKFTADLAKANGADNAEIIKKLSSIDADAPTKADNTEGEDHDDDDEVEQIEDEFDEDEDDDYNAEKYFDDGDDFGAGDDDDGEAAY